MSDRAAWALICLLSVLGMTAVPSGAEAKTRRALIIGVGNYPDASGFPKLLAPANDAEQMKNALAAPGVDFSVDILKDSEVADKKAFDAALERFLARVQPNDEVLFYFSGHGFHVRDKGNFFLLPDAKSPTVYVNALSSSDKRDLDTDDKRDKRYQDWLSSIAISEDAVEAALTATKADAVIIIADACRSLIAKSKGLTPVALNSISLPVGPPPPGVYRLYSASTGQVSVDSPEKAPSARQGRTDKSDKKDEKREASLFTGVLLQALHEPLLEINILFAKVKIDVRKQAKDLGYEQIPEFIEGRELSNFYFRAAAEPGEIRKRCLTVKTELARLREGVNSGGVGRDELERKRTELAPCGLEYSTEIAKLMSFERRGVGALSTNALTKFAEGSDNGDPAQFCDQKGSSPFDPNRPQNVSGFDVQKIALLALSKPEDLQQTIAVMRKVIDACEAAIQARPRVARYKYNLGRAHYALATLTTEKLVHEASLLQASKNYQAAADFGYVAAYNDLALLYQNGEFYESTADGTKPQLVDRAKAFDYFKRGADLGHVIAEYNLGMAYLNGELGLTVDPSTGQPKASASEAMPTAKTRETLAFQQLSRAAEGGFVPAMIQTAIMLFNSLGIQANSKRSIELLEVAASRGSRDAMFWLGLGYEQSDLRDLNEAVIWHARAAEAGDYRSQAILANMLMKGDGLPAPQPDAAGRFLRLAADAGSVQAQMTLADLLAQNKISFRPRTDGKADGGAQEIRRLYESSFARGSPLAGLRLARLFRTGFPVGHPSEDIPKSPEAAAQLLWDTIDKVRAADPASIAAKPETEIWAAAELISMYDEIKGASGPEVLTEDQIYQLRSDYGDISRIKYIRVNAVGKVNCSSNPASDRELWVLIWDAGHGPVPSEAQMDWFERNANCKQYYRDEKEDKDKDKKEKDKKEDKRIPIKLEDIGVPKKTRDIFKREFEAALKEKEAKNKDNKKQSFVDRMAAVITRPKHSDDD